MLIYTYCIILIVYICTLMKTENEIPFVTDLKFSEDNFCGRTEEVRLLEHHIKNAINTILLGSKRIGKTSLLQQLMQLATNSDVTYIYTDINSTDSIEDFSKILFNGISNAFPELNQQKLKSFHEKRPAQFLYSLFEILDKLNQPIVIVIDEFQRVIHYSEKNILSNLQHALQKLKNIRFIFCCNSEQELNELAGSSNQAFFANSDLIQLLPIGTKTYADFITNQFKKHERNISEDAVEFVLAWTFTHTYFTQVLCKRIFDSGVEEIDVEEVLEICSGIFTEFETDFFLFRNLLSPVQWILLKAIAKEEQVYHPTAKKFLLKHQIGTPANVQRALDALLKKELILSSRDENGRYFRVYDSFLSRWLEDLD